MLSSGDRLLGSQGMRKERRGKRIARTVRKGGMKRKNGGRREKQRREKIFIGKRYKIGAAAQRDTKLRFAKPKQATAKRKSKLAARLPSGRLID